MQLADDGLRLSATDLANFLACRHLTRLDLDRVHGRIAGPPRFQWQQEEVQLLRERGDAHETAYVETLAESVARLETRSQAETERAMRRGVAVIVQATLGEGRWMGRADVLRRVDEASGLGDWAYEVVDTKLSRQTKAGTILQLCLYSDLLGEIQGRLPQRMHVVSPASTRSSRSPPSRTGCRTTWPTTGWCGTDSTRWLRRMANRRNRSPNLPRPRSPLRHLQLAHRLRPQAPRRRPFEPRRQSADAAPQGA